MGEFEQHKGGSRLVKMSLDLRNSQPSHAPFVAFYNGKRRLAKLVSNESIVQTGVWIGSKTIGDSRTGLLHL